MAHENELWNAGAANSSSVDSSTLVEVLVETLAGTRAGASATMRGHTGRGCDEGAVGVCVYGGGLDVKAAACAKDGPLVVTGAVVGNSTLLSGTYTAGVDGVAGKCWAMSNDMTRWPCRSCRRASAFSFSFLLRRCRCRALSSSAHATSKHLHLTYDCHNTYP